MGMGLCPTPPPPPHTHRNEKPKPLPPTRALSARTVVLALPGCPRRRARPKVGQLRGPRILVERKKVRVTVAPIYAYKPMRGLASTGKETTRERVQIRIMDR